MSVETRNFWDSFWLSRRNQLLFKPYPSLIIASQETLGGFTGKTILEVGAGSAINSIEMARNGASCYTVDFSPVACSLSKKLGNKSQTPIHTVIADGKQLPFADGSFDLVFNQGLMEHPDLMRDLLPEQIRVVKPRGLLLIDVPQLFSIQAFVKWVEIRLGKWPFGEESNFSENHLKEILESSGLDYVKSYGREFLPIVNLGIRSLIFRICHQTQKVSITGSSDQDPFLALGTRKNFMTDIELSCLGPKILNNVGVIARKKP